MMSENAEDEQAARIEPVDDNNINEYHQQRCNERHGQTKEVYTTKCETERETKSIATEILCTNLGSTFRQFMYEL
ncbi:hypothetical protein F2Q70_00022324 [Brassica cretica]|uniref:Uncharacterized protein n=2 Tax=Brassica cretica TaxID=69181 RepID=A0A8S9GJ07_BRACR|nr:hypothetical protein F2Q70_00022324 [Brassica cretica]KAF2555619.1 hypothetical protein F2Q68_00016368 [Brassica cretica]KAF3611860.1 hypothetical protein DY000_02048791 [Brassica cretica]